jgi:NAD(P)-dependent dehydrogenase (short-subunit alcohol dehydrogenase family)
MGVDPVNPLDLTGSTILVTGASGGIGSETALLLSSLGARVVLTGRNRERLERTRSSLSGEGHRIEPFDLSASDEIPRWLRSVTAESGPLNAVVHAAGRQMSAPIRAVLPKAVDEMLRTNLTGALMLARGFVQKGCHAESGSLVFISSVMGLIGRRDISVYSAAKAALIGLTRSLALELAPVRIRVNAVAPAFVQSPMLDEVRELLSPDQWQALEMAHPLGFGTARDVAHAVAFLVAETARWITGSTLVVDGGYSAQ